MPMVYWLIFFKFFFNITKKHFLQGSLKFDVLKQELLWCVQMHYLCRKTWGLEHVDDSLSPTHRSLCFKPSLFLTSRTWTESFPLVLYSRLGLQFLSRTHWSHVREVGSLSRSLSLIGAFIFFAFWRSFRQAEHRAPEDLSFLGELMYERVGPETTLLESTSSDSSTTSATMSTSWLVLTSISTLLLIDSASFSHLLGLLLPTLRWITLSVWLGLFWAFLKVFCCLDERVEGMGLFHLRQYRTNWQYRV